MAPVVLGYRRVESENSAAHATIWRKAGFGQPADRPQIPRVWIIVDRWRNVKAVPA